MLFRSRQIIQFLQKKSHHPLNQFRATLYQNQCHYFSLVCVITMHFLPFAASSSNNVIFLLCLLFRHYSIGGGLTNLNNCGLVFSQECIPKVYMQSVYPCTIFRGACMPSLYAYTGFCNVCMQSVYEYTLFPKCVWKLFYSVILPAKARGPHFFQRVYAKQLCIHRCILTCLSGESLYQNRRPSAAETLHYLFEHGWENEE